MRSKIIALRQFYSSPLGHKVKQRLRVMALEYWPPHAGEVIVGVGYATPLLRVLERVGGKSQKLMALMPEEQGAIYWPVHADNRSVLADELRPPFASSTLDKVIVMHAFEHLAKPEELLAVFWELMVPGGRLFLVVPNRRGRWASRGHTPFTTGTPYSIGQIRQLLEDAKFTLRRTGTALFSPPSSHPLWMKCWNSIEFIGKWCFPAIGGVLIIEAEKQIYAAVGERSSAPARTRWAAQGAPIATPRTRH